MKDDERRSCRIPENEDGDGFIQGVELPVAVRAVGQYWTFSELRQLASEFRPDDRISFEQYLMICSRKYGEEPDLAVIERAFEVFDRDRTGRILLEDLRHVLSSVGEKLTHREFEELCAISGITYNGGSQTIDRQDFMTLFGVPVRGRDL